MERTFELSKVIITVLLKNIFLVLARIYVYIHDIEILKEIERKVYKIFELVLSVSAANLTNVLNVCATYGRYSRA